MTKAPKSPTTSSSCRTNTEIMSDDGYLIGTDSEEEDDPWGWYGSTFDEYQYKTNVAIRTAWLQATISSTCRNKINKRDFIVLNSWTNPNPSVSIKLSSGELKPLAEDMNISACINGFRIVQLSTGEVRAEFELIFCYGSRSYSSWKSYQEFKEMASIIEYIHSKVAPIFSTSAKQWRFVKERQRWFRCLSCTYLMEKSINLGNFVQCMLLESPSPGLILCFVQNNRFVA